MTRRQGNADLWRHSRAVARRARRTSNSGMVRTAAYFSRSGGAGADHQPRGRQRARLRRAVTTGGRRSLASRTISRQYAVRPPPAGGADGRSVRGLPDHPASRRTSARLRSGGADRRCGVPWPPGPSRQSAIRGSPASGGRCRPEVGVPWPPGPSRQSAVRGSPASGGRCRPEVGVPWPPGPSRQSAVRGSPASGGRCRPEVGVPWPPGPSRQSAIRGSPASGGRCRPEVGVPWPPGPSRQSAVRGFARLRRVVPTGGRRSKPSPAIWRLGRCAVRCAARSGAGPRRSNAAWASPPAVKGGASRRETPRGNRGAGITGRSGGCVSDWDPQGTSAIPTCWCLRL